MLDIVKSWQRFKLGLVLFAIGAGLLLSVATFALWLYWLSLAVLLSGFAIAMLGYAGIFLQRFSRVREMKHKSVRFDD